jgi:hypothetical protein
MRPSCRDRTRPKRAWGMPGAQCTRSLACEIIKHTSVVTTGPPRSPGIPARNGFNGFLRDLPGDRACLSPSSSGYGDVRARLGRRASAKLDAGVEASGPHDFTVRGQHISSVRRFLAHESFDPPCDFIARSTLPRPSHPVPNVRDDRETPLVWDGMAAI